MVMKICDFCSNPGRASFPLFKLVLITNKKTYEIGIVVLLEEIEKWLSKKYYHLSASQILLLRPDLVLSFLKQYKPHEKIGSWKFEKYTICSSCYKSYKNYVPLR